MAFCLNQNKKKKKCRKGCCVDLFIIPPINFLEFSPCPGPFSEYIQHWENTVKNIMIALFMWTTLGPPTH